MASKIKGKTKSKATTKKVAERKNVTESQLRDFTQPKARTSERVGIKFYQAGSIGLKEWGGFVSEAYKAVLQWPTVYPIYNKIIRSSPGIATAKLFLTAWARSLRPEVEMPDNPTDDDKRYQDFLISEFDNMEGGFSKLSEEMVLAWLYGWALWDVQASVRNPDWIPPQVPEIDEWRSEANDNLFGIRRLEWRSQSTFDGWIPAPVSKKIIGMKQRVDHHPPVDLLFKNCLHLTYGDPNNPEGASPLEVNYRLDEILRAYETILAIGSEHAAGHLKIRKETEGELSGDDETKIAEAANNLLSAQEGNYAYFPHGLDGDVIDVTFQAGGQILSTIKFYAIQTLQTLGMKFLATNAYTDSGAHSAQLDDTENAILIFNSVFSGFAQQYDDQIGKRLYKWNKDSFPNLTKRPKIKFSKLESVVALDVLGNFVSAIDGKIPLGEDDQKAIRRKSGFLPESLPTVNLTLDREDNKVEDDGRADTPEEDETQESAITEDVEE